jgi:subtilisin family serine protease
MARRRRSSKAGEAGGPPPAAPPPADAHEEGRAAAPTPDLDDDRVRERLTRVTVPPELDSPANRERWKLEEQEHGRGPYLIELNVLHVGGLPQATKVFLELFARVCGDLSEADGIPAPPRPARVGKSYYRCDLRVKEWRRLVAEDEKQAGAAARESGDEPRHRSIYRVWPDFPVTKQISRSVATVKADAAQRSFAATGEGVTWAVIDSGISADHPHFGMSDEDHILLHRSVKDLHRCFAPVPRRVGAVPIPRRLDDPDIDPSIPDRDAIVAEHRAWALRDDYGHGTHVAGIIAGWAPERVPVVVLEREDRIDEGRIDDDAHARVKVTRARTVQPREVERFHGVAPACRLVSLRVLDEKAEGRSSDVIRALEYVRETLNDNPKVLRVHGVNLSVGYEFDAEMFACGQSPLCSEVNRLVQAGVVVVTAAGNTGYGTVNAQVRAAKVGLSNTINDPGNAEFAITVGATHREAPHTYGVSYFSSKGPTGDGRLKPDLVAPGERIISCAAGAKLAKAQSELRKTGGATAVPGDAAAAAAGRPPTAPAGDPPDALGGAAPGATAAPTAEAPAPAYYAEDTGTSMAAPHVSGAIAAFLSIRREFIGRPFDVKKIFLDSAIPLGRERYFEGHGLLDLMKAIQSV